MRPACLCLLLILGGFTLQSEASQSVGPKPANVREEYWIQEQILLDLSEMIALGAGLEQGSVHLNLQRQDSESPPFTYNATTQLGSAEVKQSLSPGKTYIWDPQNYSPSARDLLHQLKLKPKPPLKSVLKAGENLPSKLLDLAPKTLLEENQRISVALSDLPLDANLHEQAALLLAASLFRESAFSFWERRFRMNRMTAHLALAEALSPDDQLGNLGKLAKLIGETLIFRSEAAKPEFEKLATTSPVYEAWFRATRLRVTGDRRTIPNPADASHAEQYAYLSSLNIDDLRSTALEFLEENNIPPSADWTRILFSGTPTVGQGHVLSSDATKLELQELLEVWEFHHPKQLEAPRPEDLTAWMATKTPGRAVQADGTIVVIGEGLWANFAQRHLLHILTRIHNFLEQMWGVPDRARKFREAMGALFGKLPLYPAADLYYSIDLKEPAAQLAAANQLRPLAEASPPEIPYNVYDRASHLKNAESPLPNFTSWLSPQSPAGTYFHYFVRRGWVPNRLRPAFVEGYWQQNPQYVFAIINKMRYVLDNKPTNEQIETLSTYHAQSSAELLDYITDLKVVSSQPELYQKYLAALCELAPSRFLELGRYLLRQNQPKEAAAAYQKALDAAMEGRARAVRVSVNLDWLVNYYYDQGEKEKAMVAAEFCAEVYSYGGLMTMAHLQERMDNQKEAQDYLEKIAERYPHRNYQLLAFYLRRAEAGDTDFAAKGGVLQKAIFPQGIQKIDLAKLKGQPTVGLRITSLSGIRGCGLFRNDVIVGVDNQRVVSRAQFYALLWASSQDKLTLQVWSPRLKTYQNLDLTNWLNNYPEPRDHLPRNRFNPATEAL